MLDLGLERLLNLLETGRQLAAGAASDGCCLVGSSAFLLGCATRLLGRGVFVMFFGCFSLPNLWYKVFYDIYYSFDKIRPDAESLRPFWFPLFVFHFGIGNTIAGNTRTSALKTFISFISLNQEFFFHLSCKSLSWQRGFFKQKLRRSPCICFRPWGFFS